MPPQVENTDAIWNEIVESEKKKHSLLPGEKTKRMIRDEYHMTIREVEVFLRRLKDAGRLSSREAVVDGKRCAAYSIKEEA